MLARVITHPWLLGAHAHTKLGYYCLDNNYFSRFRLCLVMQLIVVSKFLLPRNCHQTRNKASFYPHMTFTLCLFVNIRRSRKRKFQQSLITWNFSYAGKHFTDMIKVYNLRPWDNQGKFLIWRWNYVVWNIITVK